MLKPFKNPFQSTTTAVFVFNPLNASVALIETDQLICCANQRTGFYMRLTVAFNSLNESKQQKRFVIM